MDFVVFFDSNRKFRKVVVRMLGGKVSDTYVMAFPLITLKLRVKLRQRWMLRLQKVLTATSTKVEG